MFRKFLLTAIAAFAIATPAVAAKDILGCEIPDSLLIEQQEAIKAIGICHEKASEGGYLNRIGDKCQKESLHYSVVSNKIASICPPPTNEQLCHSWAGCPPPPDIW